MFEFRPSSFEECPRPSSGLKNIFDCLSAAKQPTALHQTIAVWAKVNLAFRAFLGLFESHDLRDLPTMRKRDLPICGRTVATACDRPQCITIAEV